MSQNTFQRSPVVKTHGIPCAALLALSGVLGAAACTPGDPGAGATRQRANGGPMPACTPACASPADCVPPGSPAAADADNFACVNGACQYLGCKSNAECAMPGGPPLVCAATAGSPVQACVPSCASPADCVPPQAGKTFDADNFACVASVCQHTGCKSDSECTADNGPGFVCATPPGAPGAMCLRTCSAPSDCAGANAPASADANNFACTGGLCEYLGCVSDDECAALGPGLLCR